MYRKNGTDYRMGLRGKDIIIMKTHSTSLSISIIILLILDSLTLGIGILYIA